MAHRRERWHRPRLRSAPARGTRPPRVLAALLLLLAAQPLAAQGSAELPPLNPPPPSAGGTATAPSARPGSGGLPELKPPPESPVRGSALPPGLAASTLTWHSNPHNAMARAKARHKFLLLVFGAWSWNPTTEALSWELFATREFKEYSDRWLTLAFIDFPKRKSDTHEKALAFKEAYGVRGYPTVLLIDPESGAFFRESGYRKGRARPYLESIQEAVAERQAARHDERGAWVRRGFRGWTGKDGRTLFAKLTGRSDDGRLRFVDRSGKAHEVDAENLSEQDRLLVPYLIPKAKPPGPARPPGK